MVHTSPQPAGGEERGAVTVVVSVHNALAAVEGCVASLLRHTPPHQRIVLLDDASTDPQVWPRLQELAAGGGTVEALRHPVNQGYTGTVNHGCLLAGRDDVVLLNSDTVVSPRWLEKLQRAARSRPDVATVTPLSNAAGAFSVLDNHRRNRLPPGVSVDEIADLLERLSSRILPQVPTGNGFCLYVRRVALDAVGPFDARRFPHGCGEENDFCLRASRLGFVHLIDDTTYVHHHRSASLGWRKRLLLWRSGWQLRLRYPEYRHRVASWLRDDPLDPLRAELKRRLAALPRQQ